MRSRERNFEHLEYRYAFGDCHVCVHEDHPVELPSSGLALFFVHGRYGNSETWRPVIERISDRFRCISIDLPGFGSSFSARDRGLSLLEYGALVRGLVVDLANPSDTILVGHDLGAAISQLSIVLSSDPLGGLVLLNPVSLLEPPKDFRTGWRGWLARKRLHTALHPGVAGVGLQQSRAEQSRAMAELWKTRPSRLSMVKVFESLRQTWPGPYERKLWKEKLQNSRIPTLFLCGRKDPFNSIENGIALALLLRESYFYSDTDCGHWPSLENPDWVVSRLQEFIFKLRVARRVA
ncbi:MAG TPA: alpha/beta hydrolase [Bdellovibrionota bacterium]|nr:alpha/beta hydrolase [Bdellovibrionota bacterium]